MNSAIAMLAAVLGVVLAGGAARAQTCSVSSTSVSFGSYDPFAATASVSTGSVSVTCGALASIAVTYSIQIGAGGGGGFNARALAAGAGRLGYQFYTNVTRSTVWGDGSGGTSTVSDGYLLGVLGVTKSYTVYGAIPARQIVPPGSYSDTVAVLIVY